MKSANIAAPAAFLLVDDVGDYAYLTCRAFRQVRSTANMHFLLDLDMPVMDGRQVLAEIVDGAELRLARTWGFSALVQRRARREVLR